MAAAATGDVPGDVITVVVCDDHAVFAQALSALLGAEHDIDVVGVAGGMTELLEVAAETRPDVVLVDYQLPDGDGVAATAALKAAHPEAKVVMLTSFADEGVLVAATEAGCAGYVTKHKGAEVVVSAVRLAASGEALVSHELLQRLLPRLSPTRRGVGAHLTARETEVLRLLVDGLTTHAIARRLFLSSNTVRNHVQSVLTKLGAHSRLEAVSIAVREGIVGR